MKRVHAPRQLAIERRLAGGRELRGDVYLFDQLGPLPTGARVGSSILLARVRELGAVIAFLDRHPNNIWCALAYLKPPLLALLTAQEVTADELEPLCECACCDFYVTTRNGELLAIATHEDAEENGVRQVWLRTGPLTES